MINLHYRSLKLKFVRRGRKGQWFFFIWLFRNNKKYKLIGKYFPHHFRLEERRFMRVCVVNVTLLRHYILKGVVCHPKIGKLLYGIL